MASYNISWTTRGRKVTLEEEHFERVLHFAHERGASEISIGTTGVKGVSANFRLYFTDRDPEDYLGRTGKDGNFARTKFKISKNLMKIWPASPLNSSDVDAAEIQLMEEDDEHQNKHVAGPLPNLNGTKGAPPREDRRAYTYVLRYGAHDIFKIGWAYDVRRRARVINKHIPTELEGHFRWKPILRKRWSDPNKARDMEQYLLISLGSSGYERVRCSVSKLTAKWDRYLNLIKCKD